MLTPSNHKPAVSIGLPVYNGERYLEEALDSLLAQTYEDFELIICDNASTDRSAEICLDYARRDQRVRYLRNAVTIGAADNGNRTFRFARGKYFRWAADDDVTAPTWLEQCVDVLENHPEVVLCHTEFAHIDENGTEIGRHARRRKRAMPTWRLFADVIESDDECEETYGLVRTAALATTGLEHNYTDSDRVMLAHLTLLGDFWEIEEVLFYKRIHPQMSTRQYPDWRTRMRQYGEEYGDRITLPHWMQLAHYLRIIGRSPIRIRTKLLCYACMIRWLFMYRKWRSLSKDLLLAVRALVVRTLAALRRGGTDVSARPGSTPTRA